jgi:hypothetical protein
METAILTETIAGHRIDIRQQMVDVSVVGNENQLLPLGLKVIYIDGHRASIEVLKTLLHELGRSELIQTLGLPPGP